MIGSPIGPPGQTAPVPPARNTPDPAELVDGMLKLATVYRSVESNPKERLAMERVTTLLQQILADREAAATAVAQQPRYGF